MHDVLDPCDTVPDEVEQLTTSGFEIAPALLEAVGEAADRGDRAALRALLPRVAGTARRRADWPYDEPTGAEDLAAIEARLPGVAAGRRPVPFGGGPEDLGDRVRGAWQARCAGCCMGKPLEGLRPEQIRGYLRAADAWPLRGYVPHLDPLPEGIERLNPSWDEATLGRVTGMPRDDDTDYTVLGLHLLERYGRGFSPRDVAREWLDKLPFTQTFTAERAVYRNLVSGVDAAQAATFDNPYREWIGALIRADIFGYVNPGDPLAAARLAHADASLSHTANGVYGAMWAAALVAEAFVAPDAATAVRRSADWVPERSRLSATLATVLDLHAEGARWEEAIAWVDEAFAGHSWVHTLNNAAVIAAGLLWGEGDVALSLGLTVQAGLDTDSSAATVGSVLGALNGADALPDALIAPLDDRIRSAVRGYDYSRITALADRTAALVVPGASGVPGAPGASGAGER
ncbi:ADP-ribosylglycohydrolase family protein [Streptomyces sp. PT12]|nr:ADP-ribosylglycohydrolase family protein [Streptomyces sp. PT12]